MFSFRRTKRPTLEEHLEKVQELESRIHDLETEAVEHTVSDSLIDNLRKAYSDYSKVMTEDVQNDEKAKDLVAV